MLSRVFSVVFAVVIIGALCVQFGVAAPTPISTFPFEEDFETGTLPAEIEALRGAQSDVYVTGYADNNSSYGVMLEGGPGSWGSSPSTVSEALVYTDHVPSLNMEIIPSGIPDGYLFLEFDLRQLYSFNANYSWFRVLVNGLPFSNVDGNVFSRPDPINPPNENLNVGKL